jgi:hypothetical protein
MQEVQLTDKLSTHIFSRERLFYLLCLRKVNGHGLGWLSKKNYWGSNDTNVNLLI